MVMDFIQDNYKVILGFALFIFFIVCSQILARKDIEIEPQDNSPIKWFWRKVFIHVKNFVFFITLMFFGIAFGFWAGGHIFVFIGECMFAPAKSILTLIKG